MRYYLGIDNGGTKIKAALFDAAGRMIGAASMKNEVISSGRGMVECDMEALWQNNCHVIRQLLQKSAVPPQSIAAIGLCGHGKGLYLWGQNDRPARSGILSADNRAWEYPERWRSNGYEETLYSSILQPLLACQPLALLAWLRDHEPDSLHAVRWIFSCKDYIRFRLTGKAGFELTDCSGSGLLDLPSGKYASQVLELLGLSFMENCLPPLCGSLEICGAVTPSAADQAGLRPGTPVIGGMFDIDACALASGLIDPHSICMIAGTWSINEYLRQDPLPCGSSMNSLSFLPGYYLIEESSPTSAGNCEWFIQQLMPELARDCAAQGKSIYDVVNEAVGSVSPQDDLPLFLPFLYGSNSHPLAGGAFLGMRSSHTRAHLLRAVYEGVAFSHFTHLQRLLVHYPGVPQRILLAGGVARSPVWSQIFCDVCDLPVQLSAVEETGALGCAIAAAVAIGDFPSISDAVSHMCSTSTTLYPNSAATAAYRARQQTYEESCRLLYPLWDRSR